MQAVFGRAFAAVRPVTFVVATLVATVVGLFFLGVRGEPEPENVVLFLLGMCTAAIVVTGTFTRYVKPTLMPWLAVTAVLLVVLALSAAIRDARARGRRGDDADHHDGDNAHEHRSAVVWLLVLPVALLGFVVPPALGARAAGARSPNYHGWCCYVLSAVTR